jgi:hypothetical protein
MGQLETLFDLGRWDEVLAISRRSKRGCRAERTELAAYASIFESWVRLAAASRGLAEVADALLEFATRSARSSGRHHDPGRKVSAVVTAPE